MPFGIPLYVQCIFHGLISGVPFIFADREWCRFGGTCDGFLCIMEIVCTVIFIVAYLITEVLFEKSLIHTAV